MIGIEGEKGKEKYVKGRDLFFTLRILSLWATVMKGDLWGLRGYE